jgi:putative hydrolase of the HAD superfamily
MNIKVIVFDADGVVINSPGYFSLQYQKDFGVSNDVMLPFFKGVFQDCLVGKADLREELKKVLDDWKWKGTIDELLDYWFKSEHHIDDRVLREIKNLQSKGIKCYIGTKQEKYRTEYMKKEMGFEEIFDGIYSSAYVGYKKPDERFYEEISKDLKNKEGIRVEEIMFFDDEKENVDAANKFGWQAYLYKNFNNFQEKINQI